MRGGLEAERELDDLYVSNSEGADKEGNVTLLLLVIVKR